MQKIYTWIFITLLFIMGKKVEKTQIPTKGSNSGLLYYWRILNHLSHQESPRTLEGVAYPLSS